MPRRSVRRSVVPRKKIDKVQNRRIKNVETKVNQLIAGDLAYNHYEIGTSGSSLPPYDNPSISALTLIATGDNNASRDGNIITGKNLYIRGFINRNSTANGGGAAFQARMMLVRVRQTNGTAPTLAQLFQGTIDGTTAGTGLYDIDYVKNQKGADQLYAQVLWDRVFSFANAINTTKTPTFTINYKIPKKYSRMTYDAETATTSALEENHYFFIVFGSQSTSANADVTWGAKSKFVFVK